MVEMLREADLIGEDDRDRRLHARRGASATGCCAPTSGTRRSSSELRRELR